MSIHDLIDHVKTAGALALDHQRTIRFSDRAYKSDQSVITEADHQVEDFLYRRIADHDPDANILTEESQHPLDPQRPRTYAVDPIDGTDVFSQGMPGWCISVGLLDHHLIPTAGIIYAPRLDLLLVADQDGSATLNGSRLPPPVLPEPISVRSNLMVTSRIHKTLDLSGYVGKIRGIGSAALHLCFPLIYPAVIGALEGPGAHIWDIAAAHALNRARGRDLVYLSGESIDYTNMVHGETARDVIMAGAEPIVKTLRKNLRRLS
ncbi:MAG: inositol monophosphatase family protein [Chloroflexota bacterium]|nr:inositol monophosphatase family protein [Chloroflexota bacterium]